MTFWSDFRFASPLWWLAVAPVLIVACWPHRTRAGVLFSSVMLARDLPRTWRQRMKELLPWIRGLGMVLLVVALARPQWGEREYRVLSEGVAIMAAVDRSGSMMAMDFHLEQERVNRLTAVKHVFQSFVSGDDVLPGRPDDLIGLVTFGGYAEGRVPLTLDHQALLQILDSVEIAQAVYDEQGRIVNARFLEEEQATAIGDAVALAVERLRHTQAESKVLILLSDGENTAGTLSPEEAAELAAQQGIKLYTIGIGRTGRVPFPAQDAFGRPALLNRFVRLDEATLRKLASVTGGEYFHAEDTEALQNVYTEIDQLEKTQLEGEVYIDYDEYFLWSLLLGIVLLCGERTLRYHWEGIGGE